VTQLSNEVIGALVTAAVGLDRLAGRRFVSAAAHLSWGDRGLTSAVRSYVGKVRVLVALAPPKLCGDLRSWAASGFRAVPANTISLAPSFMSVWVAPGELPAALARHETPEDRWLVALHVRRMVAAARRRASPNGTFMAAQPHEDGSPLTTHCALR
jgi:hypothetical protein